MLNNKSIGSAGIVLLFSCLFFSCQRNNSGSNQTQYELITSHKWKLFRVGEKSPNNPIQWFPAENCQKDNVWDFRTNGRLLVDEGATRCSATDPQLWFDGTWELLSNNQFIAINSPNGVQLEIVTLTSTSFSFIEIEGQPSPTYDCFELIPY